MKSEEITKYTVAPHTVECATQEVGVLELLLELCLVYLQQEIRSFFLQWHRDNHKWFYFGGTYAPTVQPRKARGKSLECSRQIEHPQGDNIVVQAWE